jgi:phage shock protein PspC (stress-responsive transcriptional regulator)
LGLTTGLLPLIVAYLVGWIIIPKGPLPELPTGDSQ